MNSPNRPRLILASASPRRKALMSLVSSDFEVVVSGIPEPVDPHLSVPMAAQKLARMKATDVASRLPDHVAHVIGCDTMVYRDDLVLNKPADADEARAMLRQLSGRTHHVVTAVAGIRTGANPASCVDCAITAVTFRDLTDDEIDTYIDEESPFDKAGGYAIQEGASSFVASVEGSLDTVIGLPVALVRQVLGQLGWKPD